MEHRDCDLCGSAARITLPRLVTYPNRVCVCKGCGVARTDPAWSEDEIREIYEKNFQEDPVAPRMFSQLSEPQRENAYFYQRLKMRRYVLPLLARHVDLSEAEVLDVRSQFGGLAAELSVAGAHVRCVDLFRDGVDWVRTRVGVPASLAPSPGRLLASLDGSFDLVTMMTVHAPGHAPSPLALLRDAHRLLKPSGILVLDEKDILRLSWLRGQFPLRTSLRSAGVHYYHLTVEAVTQFVIAAGFEILAVEWLPYSSSLRHFCVVARKKPGSTPRPSGSVVVHQPAAMYAQLHLLLLKSAAIKPIRLCFKRLNRSSRLTRLKTVLKVRLPRLATWVRSA